MDKRDAVAPMHPFPEGSAAAILVAALDHGLAARSWRFEHDNASWTATLDNAYVEHEEQSVRVEDGTRYGQGPVLTAFVGDFQVQIRCPGHVDRPGLHRAVTALITFGALPNGRYFT